MSPGAFKGVGVIAALYVTPAARMVSDVDVVIDPAALDCAVEALGDLGFALSEPSVPPGSRSGST